MNVSKKHSAVSTLASPNWQDVRPIYKKLSDEFNLLTSAFDLTIDEKRKVMLDHLIIVIDEVDLCIDELPEKQFRDDITASLIDFLKNSEKTWSHPAASPSLAYKMGNIKKIVHQEQVVSEFVEAAESIFLHTELKRHTRDKSKLLDHICKEGEATARLPLSILKVAPDHSFSKFFTRLCRLMGIADLVFDAGSDYEQQLIVYKPNLSLYASLNFIMAKEGLKLLWYFPKRLQFLLYCVRFTWALFKEESN